MTKKRDWWLRREMVDKEERWLTRKRDERLRREMGG
jgi:hypothetical protein